MNDKDYNKLDKLPPGGYGFFIISFLVYIVAMILIALFTRVIN